MVRRLLNWKTLLCVALCIIVVGILLARFIDGSGVPSAKRTSVAPTAKTTATAASKTTILQLPPFPTTTPTISATPTVVAPKIAGQRQVVFVNKMQETVWVAAASSGGHAALAVSGWVLAPGASVSIPLPDAWNGRFWGRTGCSLQRVH